MNDTRSISPDLFENGYKDSYVPNLIFGTPIWHLKYELPKGAYEWALKYKKNNSGRLYSNYGGYQSTDFSIVNSPFGEHIQNCLYFLPEFMYLDGWLNINSNTDFNMMHDHPQSDLAVIWYITDNMPGKLIFKDPHSFARSRLYNKINQSIPMKENINQQYAPVCNAGDILIFPADLLHGVTPSYKKELRISVSFNLLLKPY